MSVQNCCVGNNESVSENLANALARRYRYEEILKCGKVAYIDSYGYESDGIYEHFLYKNALEFVDLYSDFGKFDLAKYCAIILPMSIDEVALWSHREKLYEFLESGGVVMSFCHNYTGILPNNAGYVQSPVAIKDREVKLVGHALTQGVREYDINYRRGVKGFFNRGYFELPQELEQMCRSVIVSEQSFSLKACGNLADSPAIKEDSHHFMTQSSNDERTDSHAKKSACNDAMTCQTATTTGRPEGKVRSIQNNPESRDISLSLNMTNNGSDISPTLNAAGDDRDVSPLLNTMGKDGDISPTPNATNKDGDISVASLHQYDNVVSPSCSTKADKVGGYKPFEVFLCDSEGQCVGYIDRISTRGTILATAGADLLSFGVFENTSARRLGVNLLHWLGNELKLRESNFSLHTSNATTSVIASKQSERGNLAKTASDLQNTLLSKTRDCHDSALHAESRNDGIMDCHAKSNDFARDDKQGICRPEGEARSVSNNLKSRDISLSLNMTNNATNDNQSNLFHFDKTIIAKQTPKNPLSKNPKLKNAIITGGASYERNFFYNKDAKYAQFFNERIYHKDAQNADFSELDYIVIASRANPRFLAPCADKFKRFLESGGSIVSFGEVTQGYLPNIAWKQYDVNFWWWLSEGADMPFEVGEYGRGLFEKMDVFSAKWHYHGAFYPPKDSQMILSNELGEAIIYKDTSFKGGLYVTSLDPDFHLGQGFMPKTEPFFDNFVAWVEEDILRSRI